MTAGRDALRAALAKALTKHRDLIELVDAEGVPDGNGELFRYGCTCGHVRGVWTEREAIARLKQSWQEQHDHVADALAVEAERFAAEQVAAAHRERDELARQLYRVLIDLHPVYPSGSGPLNLPSAATMTPWCHVIRPHTDEQYEQVQEAEDVLREQFRRAEREGYDLRARAAAVLAAGDNDRRQG